MQNPPPPSPRFSFPPHADVFVRPEHIITIYLGDLVVDVFLNIHPGLHVPIVRSSRTGQCPRCIHRRHHNYPLALPDSRRKVRLILEHIHVIRIDIVKSTDVESIGLISDIVNTPVLRIQEDAVGLIGLAIEIDLVQYEGMDQRIAKEGASVVRDSCVAEIQGPVGVHLPLGNT